LRRLHSLAPELHEVDWPTKFRPSLPAKYDGSVNPVVSLHIYITAMGLAGRNEVIMANYFSIVLTRPARSCLMNLPQYSIPSWEELCCQFLPNFESSYKHPEVEANLHVVRQRPDETL
jgi:hypothetical protein